MDEDQLRPLFEQAGPIAHIMVIRDRQTDAHRGERNREISKEGRNSTGIPCSSGYYDVTPPSSMSAYFIRVRARDTSLVVGSKLYLQWIPVFFVSSFRS